MVSPNGCEIWATRFKDILFRPSKLLCSILSKKASTQYRRIALKDSSTEVTMRAKIKQSLNLAGDSLPVDSEAVRPAQSGVYNGHGM